LGQIVSTKVLVIDDDAFLTNFLKDSLSRSSFEVFVSNSGIEGIKIIHQIQPDVVVLDLMMPGMTGWEVCKTIRTFSPVPILILSAVVDHELVMQALDNGADDYVVKPVATNVLVSRLRRLTQQARIKGDD
jgi:two-component system, OmpR family, response regulator MprA